MTASRAYLAHPIANGEADDPGGRPRGHPLRPFFGLFDLCRVVLEVDDGAVCDLYVPAEVAGGVEEVLCGELLHPSELAAGELDLRPQGEMQGEGGGPPRPLRF